MRNNKMIFTGSVLVAALCAMLACAVQLEAQILLTEAEREYVHQGNVIQAVSLDGAAPLQFSDADGQVQGISKEVLEEVARLTGLVFEYRLYDRLEDAFNSGADVFFGIPRHYAPEDMVL